jgi:hypothetical protein
MNTLTLSFLSVRSALTIAIALAVVGGRSAVNGSVPVGPFGVERLADGNTLIADCGSTSELSARAVEVDSLGRLVWAYVKCDVPFLHTARRLANGNTLLSSSRGNRVIEVNPRGDTVWAMADGLAYPNDACRLPNGNTLITDRDNNRVIEVTTEGTVVWSYSNLSGPHNGSRLPNGNTLICDSQDDRVIEVDPSGAIVWQYATGLRWPRCAQRLANGNTLITDSDHNRVIEVDGSGMIVWSVTGLVVPFAAERLANGNTLVSCGSGLGPGRVVELLPSGKAAWQYPNTPGVVVDTLRVVNPSSGCSLYVHIHRPAYADAGRRVPGVVFVPYGSSFGSSFDDDGTPDDIASDGFAFLHFDPDGRGQSDAFEEDYDGYVQQDGLHACLALLASRSYVDTSRLGVYSRGYGITMASGAIARYSEPRVKFLLDFEGPADRSQTCRDSGGSVPVPADSNDFWHEREAARFMKQVPAAYLRMQTAIDHKQNVPSNRHCIELVDSATAAAHGGTGISLWTRVNDSVMNPPNRVYTPSALSTPAWIPESEEPQNDLRVLLYLHELADLGQSAVTERGVLRRTMPLVAYPQPCHGLLQVELTPGSGQRELQVHDVCGRLLKQVTVPAGAGAAGLDLRALAPGVYYVSAAGAGTVPAVIVR